MNDAVRDSIRAGLAENKRSKRWLSLQLGQNHAYIQQFLERGTPDELDLQDVVAIARLLNMPLRRFGVDEVDLKPNGVASTAPVGLAEDAAEYHPPAGSILLTGDNISYYRMTSDALETHPLRIVAGDIIAFDLSAAAVEQVKSEAVVLLRCYDPDPNVLAAKTIVREFIRPSLVTTNRARANEAFSLDDPALPFEPNIVGVLRNVVRSA